MLPRAKRIDTHMGRHAISILRNVQVPSILLDARGRGEGKALRARNYYAVLCMLLPPPPSSQKKDVLPWSLESGHWTRCALA